MRGLTVWVGVTCTRRSQATPHRAGPAARVEGRPLPPDRDRKVQHSLDLVPGNYLLNKKLQIFVSSCKERSKAAQTRQPAPTVASDVLSRKASMRGREASRNLTSTYHKHLESNLMPPLGCLFQRAPKQCRCHAGRRCQHRSHNRRFTPMHMLGRQLESKLLNGMGQDVPSVPSNHRQCSTAPAEVPFPPRAGCTRGQAHRVPPDIVLPAPLLP